MSQELNQPELQPIAFEAKTALALLKYLPLALGDATTVAGELTLAPEGGALLPQRCSYLVLFGMQNRTFGPYLAVIDRIAPATLFEAAPASICCNSLAVGVPRLCPSTQSSCWTQTHRLSDALSKADHGSACLSVCLSACPDTLSFPLVHLHLWQLCAGTCPSVCLSVCLLVLILRPSRPSICICRN
jgi:hypothetical protein